MKDGIIKGTGNSRYLKSSISSSTTLAQLITMLRNGTFPVDFNGINENGWQQLGTAFNKANCLTDSTKNSIGLTQSDPTIDNALSKLRSLITTAQSTASGRAQIQVGSYTGTGTWGSSNPNSITFSFAPKLVWIYKYKYIAAGGTFFMSPYYAGGVNNAVLSVDFSSLSTTYKSGNGFSAGGRLSEQASYLYSIKNFAKRSGNTLLWYFDYDGTDGYAAFSQCNVANTTYYWVAFS